MRVKKDAYIILGVDPGINRTGLSISHYHPDTDKLHVVSFFQLEAAALAKKEMKQESKQFGNVVSLFLYEREFENIMNTYTPNFVACEDAFYCSKFPTAYLSLKLCITSIQRVLFKFNQILFKIPPKMAKQAVSTGTADKLAVQEAIQHLPDLILKDTKQNPLDKITEHEADSIAIAYAFKKMILPDLLLQSKGLDI